MNTQRLLTWINEHDCGVTPTAVLNEDNTITIRGTAVGPDGTVYKTQDVVNTYQEARDVLGY